MNNSPAFVAICCFLFFSVCFGLILASANLIILLINKSFESKPDNSYQQIKALFTDNIGNFS